MISKKRRDKYSSPTINQRIESLKISIKNMKGLAFKKMREEYKKQLKELQIKKEKE